MACAANGDVIFACGFMTTIDFGGGPLTSAGHWDVFLVKFRDPPPTAVPGQATAGLLRLDPIWPNPFNPATMIAFAVDTDGPVTLEIVDIAGRRVRTLVDGAILPRGPQRVSWDGLDDAGRGVASGHYLARLRAGRRSVVAKATLLR